MLLVSNKKLTLRRLNMLVEMSSDHWYSHLGHFFFTCQYLNTDVHMRQTVQISLNTFVIIILVPTVTSFFVIRYI